MIHKPYRRGQILAVIISTIPIGRNARRAQRVPSLDTILPLGQGDLAAISRMTRRPIIPEALSATMMTLGDIWQPSTRLVTEHHADTRTIRCAQPVIQNLGMAIKFLGVLLSGRRGRGLTAQSGSPSFLRYLLRSQAKGNRWKYTIDLLVDSLNTFSFMTKVLAFWPFSLFW